MKMMEICGNFVIGKTSSFRTNKNLRYEKEMSIDDDGFYVEHDGICIQHRAQWQQSSGNG
jgi:hypothetical protein